MALSDQERQILEQMERELRIQDPDLASTMSSQPAPKAIREHKSYSPRRVATGIVIAVVGLILPLVGISVGPTWLAVLLGVAGFALMLVGVLMIAVPTEQGGTSQGKSVKSKSDFMTRQQQKWDQRKN
ncbi:DUF3040 domain-containing protein [Gleimia europaea]|uniref:DUF3040 domain-containing protein n=1 Tax=Gleimia europaea ACS-120-V-Col10b TaxID=883069 RepID=A0A9W5VW70_9ACTO|nr:DUF3040 domain-containing protein [Gleimia europaea]EPD30575.1 hypothetical protein HMPREF9238_00321 [Gleimia europaea ACS-120-V-Col10b]